MMMKKMILSMAIAAIAFGGFSASAKETAKNACPVTGNERNVCDQQRTRPCPFDGINLTDAQKEQLKEVCHKGAADKQARKDANREARNQSRRDQLAKIKAILTPEQYVQFLENSFVNGKNGHKANKRHNGQRPARDGRHNSQRPDKAPRQQANQ